MKRISGLFVFGSALLLCSLGTTRAGTATSITGLYTTGASGTTRDSNWRESNGSRAYVVTNNVPGDWAPDTASAQWISYAANPNQANATYTYTLSFTIGGTGTGAVSNVAITLTLAVDDSASVYVNGGNTGVTTSGWNTTKTLVLNSTNSNFQIGTNTLTINVSNSGAGATGLLVSSITGAVPEVATWLPVAGALSLFGWIRLRPKKTLALSAP